MLSSAAALVLGFGGAAHADSKILNCHNTSGQIVACNAGYSDGTAVASAQRSEGKKVLSGSDKADAQGKDASKASQSNGGDESIVVRAGPSLLSNLPSKEAAGPSNRPGADGDWSATVAAADKADQVAQLQQWRNQYQSETSSAASWTEDRIGR